MAVSKRRKKRRRRTKKVVSIHNYRVRLNMGVFIFSVIFLYMIISIGIYLTRERISIYEVSVQGSLTKSKSYTGLILRQEEVSYANGSGYVNYYLREGGRAGIGDVIYTLDESGRLSELLFSDSSKSLEESDLSDLKTKLTSYCMSYDSLNFHEVYNMKIEMDYSILELANSSNIANLEQVVQAQIGGAFLQGTASKTGTISYCIDGYEGYTKEQVTAADFTSSYTRKSIKSGELLTDNGAIYKTVTSDQWSLIFPIPEEDLPSYRDKSTLTIQMEKDGFEITGDFSLFSNETGTFGEILIQNYMVRYLSERFLDFEIQELVETGLKIPKTALVEKNFYMIPKEYRITNGENQAGFLIDGYNTEKQEQESRFVSPTIYSSDEEYFYISLEEEGFSVGTYLNQTDGSTRYQIGATASLKGVYTVNQGYTVFRFIEILTENDEYYIVKTDTRYGLSLYDHIILNSKTVKENQVIYQ